MKRHLITAAGLSLLALSATGVAQQPASEVATWSTTVVPVKSAGGERLYRVQIDGRIAAGYVVYASDFKAELGPNPTRLRFAADSGVTAQGELESTGTHKGKDKAFKVDYTYFEGEAKLAQVVAVAPGTARIVGTLRGQTCYEADGTCALFTSRIDLPLPD
ncbi:MAG: hypothetical protein ABW278_01160 [Steroidobacteraceae bacterium]